MKQATTKKHPLPKPAAKPLADTADSLSWQRYKYVFLALILALAALLYFPSALKNGFTRYWDDEVIIVQNEDIRELSWEHVQHMFTQSYYDMYCPVKILSHTLDYQICRLLPAPDTTDTLNPAVEFQLPGLNPAGYHLMSLLYHLVNVVLLFLLIGMMLKSSPAALAAALIYAVHPTAVETVSWVTGRGDLLYALFAFPALMCYVKYITRGQRTKHFLFAFLFFILSILSKPTAMTLPLTLLAFDWYYRRKIFSMNVLAEKIPFIIISVSLGILSIQLRSAGAMSVSEFFGYFESFKGVLFITYPLAFYMVKFLFPLPLSFIYPHVYYYFENNITLPPLVWLSPLILLAALILIYKAKKMRRQLLFAGLLYFTTIFSTLQIIPIVAVSAHDRYFYVPIVGFLFFTAWLYVYFKQNNKRTAIKIYAVAVVVIAAAFAGISFDRTKIWKSTVTMFEDVVKKHPRFVEGYDKLSEHYAIGHDYRNAAHWAKQTLKVRKTNTGTAVRLVKCYIALNELDSAALYAPEMVKGAKNEQQFIEAYKIKAHIDMKTERYADAIADYDILLKQIPDSVKDLYQRAVAKMHLQRYEAALADISRVLQFDANQDVYFMRGIILIQMGRRAAACADLHKAESLGHLEAPTLLKEYCR
jgi:tetratricopeptide (TPR) repeat protein